MAKPFRDLLYENYSAHIGRVVPEKQVPEAQLRLFFHLYRQVYGRCSFPDDKQIKIADLGCADGKWLHWVKSLGYIQLVGIDHSASELVPAEGMVFHEGDIGRILSTQPEEYDLLHLKDVIEHCTKQETVDLLTVCRDALKPGGQLWVGTFNGQAPMNGVTHRGDFTHESAFTVQSLAQVLRACGFRVDLGVGVQAFSTGLKGLVRRCAAFLTEKTANFVYFSESFSPSKDPNLETGTMKPGILLVATRPV